MLEKQYQYPSDSDIFESNGRAKIWTKIPAKLAAALTPVYFPENMIKLSSFLRVTLYLVEKPMNLFSLLHSTSPPPFSSSSSFSFVLEKKVKWEKTGRRKTEG